MDLVENENIKNKDTKMFEDKKTMEDFIYRLLRSGYINENYLDYISIFHEGTLRKSDYDFLLKIKRNEKVHYNYKLYQTDELIKQINLYDFEKNFVLNYNLIDMLIGSNYQDKKEKLYKQLGNESNSSIEFIDNFISITEHLEEFIQNLCSYWNEIWLSVFGNPSFSEERQQYYFELIIKYADIDDIGKIFKKNDSYIANYENFFFITTDYTRLFEIISILDIRFRTINFDTPADGLDYIFENNYYEINTKMFEFLLSRKTELNCVYYTSNYKFILSCGIESLKNYVNDFPNAYIENIYLQLEDNNSELLDSYIELLNNPDITDDLKDMVIQKEETIVESIADIVEKNVQSLVITNKKMSITWKNVYHNYLSNKSTFSGVLIDYLNAQEIAEKLSKIKIPNIKNAEGISIYSEFNRAIIYEERFTDETYRFLTKASPWRYKKFDAERITQDRISILIKNDVVTPEIETFEFLRNHFEGKQIELFEKYSEKFLEELESLHITKKEVELIVKSEKITKETKYLCVKQLSEADILNSLFISNFVISCLTSKSIFTFSNEIKKALLLNEQIKVSERINLFSNSFSVLSTDEHDAFFESLGKDYSELSNKHKRAVLSKTEGNRKLLQLLQKINYISSFIETPKGYMVYHKSVK